MSDSRFESLQRRNLTGEIPIEKGRRLISDGFERGLSEYYDADRARRVIAIPLASEQADIHDRLAHKGIPLFMADYGDDRLSLIVPTGTVLLRNRLRSIARDIPNYRPIFHNLGTILFQLQHSGEGLPQSYIGRTMLDNFALSRDDTAYGGKLFLAPPYDLSTDINHHQVRDMIQADLQHADVFMSTEVELLMNEVDAGWLYEPRS